MLEVAASAYTMFIYSIVFYMGNKIFCNMRFFLNESKQFQGDRAHEKPIFKFRTSLEKSSSPPSMVYYNYRKSNLG